MIGLEEIDLEETIKLLTNSPKEYESADEEIPDNVG